MIADDLERELADWNDAFDRLIVKHKPDIELGWCEDCGEHTVVYTLHEKVSGMGGPLLCRPCLILNGMRYRHETTAM